MVLNSHEPIFKARTRFSSIAFEILFKPTSKRMFKTSKII
jgi:hypothetical protein